MPLSGTLFGRLLRHLLAVAVALSLLALSLLSVVACGGVKFFTEFPVPTASGDPSSITAGPDGNVWFTETDANQIGYITPPSP